MLFGSTTLEVAIGMVFVYLLLSLLCSAINEYIEATLNYRGKNLRKGIELLLNDQGRGQTGWMSNLLQRVGITSPPKPKDEQKTPPPLTTPPGDESDLADKLYSHGLIRGLYRDQRQRKLPSYIPARTFALALWNMAGGSLGDGGDTTDLEKIKVVIREKITHTELQQALITLIDDAGGDFNKARRNIEEWYNAAMDRVSGWYKRRVQIILLGLGFALSAFINADSITIANAFFQNGTLRNAVVAAAGDFGPLPTPSPVATPSPASGGEETADPAQLAEAARQRDAAAKQRVEAAQQRFHEVRDQVKELGLPIGWVRTERDKATGKIINQDDPRRWRGRDEEGFGYFFGLKLLGIFLTGLAISQGAPFWFDILNKFMVIRSTVKPREKSHEEKSKDSTGATS